MSVSETKYTKAKNYTFLSGGGEMGKLIRATDWSKTPLGNPADWPQSLRTMVSVLLDNPFGMYIAWGKEYTQIYNDGYRPILGSTKHPQALGISTRETFSEIWHIIESMFAGVMDGKAVGFPNFELPLNRNGYVELCYFDFSYSPIRKENGEVGGVLVTVIETTNKKKAETDLLESNSQLAFAIEATELGTFDFDPLSRKFSGNERLKKWFGFTAENEIELEDAIKNITEKDQQRVTDAINQVLDYSSGGHYDIIYTIVHPVSKKERVVKAKGKAWFNDDKIAYRFNGTLQDITEQHTIEKIIAENERNLRLMILQAPVAIAILRGPEYVVEIANKRALELWGRTEEEVLDSPILEAMPELVDQGIQELINDVYKTGNRFAATELPVELLRKGKMETTYINFSYEALHDSDGEINGIMAIGFEVTEQVIARKKVEEAEERMRLATEATELATWDLDLQTRNIIHSPRLAKIFGHKDSKKISHQEMRNQIHPDDREAIVERAFEKALNTGVYFYEARLIKPDKSICWIRTQGKVFYDEKKLAHKMIGTLRDITEEKVYREELEEREQKFRVLADFMPQFVWTGDAQGNLNYFNQAVYDYSGLTPEQVEKEGWIQIVHPDEREENVKVWVDAITNGTDFIFEHRFKSADGVYRWQLSRAIPLRDANGIIQMWVGTSTDIHDIKEQDQQKDYFISMASHELKTPVTSIKGYVQILKTMYAGKEDIFLINSLNIVDKQILTLTNLISDLLDVSKIKTGGLVFNKEDFEITKLIYEIADEIKNINPGYKIEVSAEKNIHINADRDRIGQVLINFLTNAIKYSPQSNAIKIKTAVKDNQLVVSVEDKGIGISKKDQERIFERFYRVEGKSENTFPGFGIGLFIVAEIIQRHNGSVSVESKPGKGSIFSFTLPI